MNKDKFFIYAGPPKTGSTWLFTALTNHPDVEMPLLKELKYFYIRDKVGNISLLNRLFGWRRLLWIQRKWFWRNFNRRFQKVLKAEPDSLKYFRFLLYYFFSQWNDKWYQTLFPSDKLSGDISPNYCTLSETSIEQIKAFNPKTKIIIGLRDPVEKKWSGIKMRLLTMKGKTQISEANQSKLKRMLSTHSPDYDDYTLLLDKWYKHFNADQILVYYFDELKENPQQLYDKICNFLGLPLFELATVKKVVNKGAIGKPTHQQRKTIIDAQYPYIEKFAKHYPNEYSLRWLERYRENKV